MTEETRKAIHTGSLISLGVLGVALVVLIRHENALFAQKHAVGQCYGIDYRWATMEEQGQGNWLRGFLLTPPTFVNLHTGELEWTPLLG